jgi:hypothetical protein
MIILMNPIQYALGILGAVFTLGLVIEMLRRRRLRERHAVWWLILGVFALIISIFPEAIAPVASSIGFETPINLVFFFSLFVLFLVALQHSAELTRVESQNQNLAERLVLLELRTEAIEAKGAKKK